MFMWSYYRLLMRRILYTDSSSSSSSSAMDQHACGVAVGAEHSHALTSQCPLPVCRIRKAKEDILIPRAPIEQAIIAVV